MKMFTQITGILLLLLTEGSFALANENNLILRGVLAEPPPCTLNGGNTVDVSFGERIGIRKVEQGIYRQTVDLGLECDNDNLSWQLTLRWTGNSAGFDSEHATVRTEEQASLGVKMYAAGQPLELNAVMKVNGNTLPLLEAVLVQEEGAELDEGEFTARGSFLAEFQ